MLINNADAGNVEMIYIDGMTRCVKLENLKLSQDPHFYTTNVFQMVTYVSDWVENIAGNGENAGYQHFLHFPQYFQKASFPGSLTSALCYKRPF